MITCKFCLICKINNKSRMLKKSGEMKRKYITLKLTLFQVKLWGRRYFRYHPS